MSLFKEWRGGLVKEADWVWGIVSCNDRYAHG